jgi:dynein heavy chain
VETLEQATPAKVKEQLPLLLYSIRMIFNIDKYYSNRKNIVKLFRRLTNQMITCCKLYIKSKTNNCRVFWDYAPIEDLIRVFDECIKLNQQYRKEFSEKHGDNDARHNPSFDFSEDELNQIFAMFDSFKRKLSKLIEVFLIKKQINTLEH